MALKDDIKAISDQIASANTNAQSLGQTLQQLNQLKARAPIGSQELADINKLIDATKDLRTVRKEGAEEERRNLETMGVQNKVLIELVEKLKEKHKLLANAILQGAAAYDSFVHKADLGKTIQHLGAMTPLTKTLGTVLGFVVGQAVKFQDRIQVVNKSIIDLSAATGHYTEGLKLADGATLAISEGFAQYGQQVGIASKELQRLSGNLGQVGFSMEEMGIDKQTGKITSLTSAVTGNSKSWGVLSASIGIARVTGLEQGQVISQLQTQIKTLGGTVEGTVKTFASLSLAAGKSKLSTATLLPVLQSMQSSFKFLGIDSSAAAEMIGKAGSVAEKAGVGASAAVEVMGKAIAGIAQMDFGQMAFLGQQTGMGGGLSAGFQFRQKAGGTGGADMAQQIGQVVGRLMGGTGDIISEGQAAGNEQLAAIRLGQEKLAAQTMGLTQNEARVFLNMTKELEALNASGAGSSQKAEELKKKMGEMAMGEKEYRAKTLTAQEKIARILELIGTLVGRAVLIFVRAFAGGVAKEGGLGETISGLMTSISKGEGLDADAWEKSMAKVTSSFDNTLKPAIEGVGGFLGKVIGFSWPTTIALMLGGPIALGIIKDAFGGLLRRALVGGGGDMVGGLLGKLLRGPGGTGGRIAAAGAGNVVQELPILGRLLSGTMRVLNADISSVSRLVISKLGMSGGMAGKGIMAIAGAAGPASIALLAVAAATAIVVKLWENAAKKELEKQNKLTGETNKQLTAMQKVNAALQERTKLTSQEALSLAKRVQSGAKLTDDEKRLWETRKEMILRQAQLEVDSKRIIMDGQIKAMGPASKEARGAAAELGKLNDVSEGLRKTLSDVRAAPRALPTTLLPVQNAQNETWTGAGQAAGPIINKTNEERAAAASKKEDKKNNDSNVKVDVNVKLNDPLLDAKVEKGVVKASEKDIVAPGKSGMSGNRYGTGQGY